MSARPILLLVLLGAAGCSCSDELPVGALPSSDAGGDAVRAPADAAPVVERPCGVPERRLTVPVDADSELLGVRGIALRGAGDTLYLALGRERAPDDWRLIVYGLDLSTESLVTVVDVPSPPDMAPVALRVGDTIDVLRSGGGGTLDWARIGAGGAVESVALGTSEPITEVVPGPRGFIAAAGSRLLHVTAEGVVASTWSLPGQVRLYADEQAERAYAVAAIDGEEPTLTFASVPAADPTSVEPRWVELFRGSAGEDTPALFGADRSLGGPLVYFFRAELLDPSPSYGLPRLHLLWLDEDGAVRGRWEGAEGFDGAVSVAGDGPSESLFAWLGSSSWSTRGVGITWSHGQILGPGAVSALRVVTDLPLGYLAPTSTWVTAAGAHAAGLYRFSQLDVVITCEGGAE